MLTWDYKKYEIMYINFLEIVCNIKISEKELMNSNIKIAYIVLCHKNAGQINK